MFNRKTTEIFGGGACKGFYIAGYMKAKENLGLTDSKLGFRTTKYGVSVGSLFSAIMSEKITFFELDDYFKKNIKLMKSIFAIEPIKVLSLNNGTILDSNNYHLDKSYRELPNTGIGNSSALEKIVTNLIGNNCFKDRPDLNFVVTDMETLNPLIINYETSPNLKISEGILASSSFPPIFPIRKISYNGVKKYVSDGGILLNFPICKPLSDKKNVDIIGVNFAEIETQKRVPENWIDNFSQSVFFGSTYLIKEYFNNFLNMDYVEFIKKGGVKKIYYQGHRKNLMILNPTLSSKYTTKTDYETISELTNKGYIDSKIAFNSFKKIKNKLF